MVQLHGDEPPAVSKSIELPVIKALRLRRNDTHTLGLIESHPADYLLVEPYVEGKYGGTGKVADWQLAGELVASYPNRRFFLAGGLNPENVGDAIRVVRPYAVDASSGVETRPGIKDPAKIKAFTEVVKSL
jgi:phosphoribosylanthranilate isomerase